ncbi:GGDEF domain-containing protein [Phaeovulum vinaykumarii]|uniref:diguanylate cyclase n=1 Tax=Phaeovulum vinaykumarii TaxID=407234 RepID=A0A1N7LG64_9RHOB|nr:GGDEF domain-containing protein [Phaeovulum vinaykumarii]SIS72809.1 diguanylate cyclase (GGDEF) domain-containing protein [Phaeovulum vinaykumarii]SOC04521.1 diguanylate cyclase (GGDEF)-like protein [Phaeovulum vinaykumarii]
MKSTITWAMRAGPWLAALATGLCLVGLGGYVLDREALHQLLPVQTTSHPVTLLSALMLGLSLMLDGPRRQSPARRGVKLALAVMALALCLTRLVLGSDPLLAQVAPDVLDHVVQDRVLPDRVPAPSHDMTRNAALTLAVLSLAVGARALRRPGISQTLALVAGVPPVLSFAGTLYGMGHFYGEMSAQTTVLCALLISACLAMGANRGALRVILGDEAPGRIVRRQILIGLLVPLAVGYWMIAQVEDRALAEPFALAIVALGIFVVLLVSVSALWSEREDRARRRREREARHMASHDALTGLLNRHRFERDLLTLVERARREAMPLALIIVDLDHFKLVNDTGGHACGDLVLRRTGAVLSDRIRHADQLARIGGEEFALLLPDTDRQAAIELAERMRRAVAEMRLEPWSGHSGRLTASLGCAVYQSPETAVEFLARADAALYIAKARGRDRVVAAGARPTGIERVAE